MAMMVAKINPRKLADGERKFSANFLNAFKTFSLIMKCKY